MRCQELALAGLQAWRSAACVLAAPLSSSEQAMQMHVCLRQHQGSSKCNLCVHRFPSCISPQLCQTNGSPHAVLSCSAGISVLQFIFQEAHTQVATNSTLTMTPRTKRPS